MGQHLLNTKEIKLSSLNFIFKDGNITLKITGKYLEKSNQDTWFFRQIRTERIQHHQIPIETKY